MSDPARRALERQAALADPAARVALLRERQRAGALTPERLRLAAALGAPEARALAPDAGDLLASGRPLAWFDALDAADEEAGLRARFAVAWALEPRWSAWASGRDVRFRPFAGLAAQTLRAGAALWLQGPGFEAAAESRSEQAYEVAHAAASEHPGLSAPTAAAAALQAAARAAEAALALRTGQGEPPTPAHLLADDPGALALAREALAAEVIPWALGDGDPLRERAG